LHARHLRGVGEFAVTIVAIQIGESSAESIRPTVSPNPPCESAVQTNVDVSGPLQIITNEEIKVGVIVEIEPRGACRPGIFGTCHSSVCGHVCELATTFIMEQVVTA
jgi:hypothetical protein